MHQISVEPKLPPGGVQQSTTFFATVDGGARFLVGRSVRYAGSWGLMREGRDETCNYAAEDYKAQYGVWSELLDATAICESNRSFLCLNTYDRAKITFGAFQFAGHEPDDDFVTWFHDLLRLPEAPDYYPELSLVGGRVTLMEGGAATQLESATTTAKLQGYFKPDTLKVTAQEVERAARLMAMTHSLPGLRQSQVKLAYDMFKSRAKAMAAELDGKPDYIACAALDIRHQGRGKPADIHAALYGNPDPEKALDALLEVGAPGYKQRRDALRDAIAAKRQGGALGVAVYSAASNDLLPRKPWAALEPFLALANMPAPDALVSAVPASPLALPGHAPAKPAPAGAGSEIEAKVASFCVDISATANDMLKQAGAGHDKAPAIVFSLTAAPSAGNRTPEEQARQVQSSHSWVCWGAHMADKARDIVMRVDGKVSYEPKQVFGASFGAFTKAWGAAMAKHGLKNYEAGDGWAEGDEFHLELPNARMAVTDERAKACLKEYVRLTRVEGKPRNEKFERKYLDLLKPYIEVAGA